MAHVVAAAAALDADDRKVRPLLRDPLAPVSATVHLATVNLQLLRSVPLPQARVAMIHENGALGSGLGSIGTGGGAARPTQPVESDA